MEWWAKEQEQTMWHTSCGNRTLHGAEARLFANALLRLLDEAVADQFEDYDLDLPCFAQVPPFPHPEPPLLLVVWEGRKGDAGGRSLF
jgi:hypothetical protein